MNAASKLISANKKVEPAVKQLLKAQPSRRTSQSNLYIDALKGNSFMARDKEGSLDGVANPIISKTLSEITPVEQSDPTQFSGFQPSSN